MMDRSGALVARGGSRDMRLDLFVRGYDDDADRACRAIIGRTRRHRQRRIGDPRRIVLDLYRPGDASRAVSPRDDRRPVEHGCFPHAHALLAFTRGAVTRSDVVRVDGTRAGGARVEVMLIEAGRGGMGCFAATYGHDNRVF